MLNPQHNGQGTSSRIAALPCVPNKDIYFHGTQTGTLLDSISKVILLLKPQN